MPAFLKISIPLALAVFFSSFVFFCDSNAHKGMNNKEIGDIVYLYSQPKDTVHLLGDSYILISLKKQNATVVRRDSSEPKVFPVSTGHAGISQGMSTPPGLYTVQSKLEKAISKQFNDAELLSWVGFNGNIGFHGLSGSGYYSHLGVRPSSHGCVRISREDGKKLYKMVKVGTPVLVFNSEPALTFSFSNISSFEAGTDVILEKKTSETDLLVKSRIEALYEGEYYKLSNSKLFMDGVSIIRNRGFAVGQADKISNVQQDYKILLLTQSKYRDLTSVRKIFFERILKDKDSSKTSEKNHKQAKKS